MIRDFSDAAKEHLIEQVKRVTPEGFLEKAGDFLGDAYLNFRSKYGSLNIEHYVNDVDTYHEKILDCNDTTVGEIEQIFLAVHNVDNATSAVVTPLGDVFQEQRSKISRLCETLNISTKSFVSSTIQAIQSGEKDPKDYQKTVITLHEYPDGVKRGEIRWVDQTGSVENNDRNGWGDYNNRDYGWNDGSPESQCNSATESMALSYLGIDRSPGSLVPEGTDLDGLEVASYGTDTREWTAPDGSKIQIDNYAYCDMEDINARVQNFTADANRGDVAPVMIRYDAGGGNGHWIMLTGQNPDGTYSAIGPGGPGEQNITVRIDANGNISGNIAHGGGKIQRYAQYTRK